MSLAVVGALSVVGLVAALAVVAVLAVMARIHRPTKGTPIAREHAGEAALVIVDMQTDFVDHNGYDRDKVRFVIDGINSLCATANREGKKVVVLRQVYQGLIANAVINAVGKGLGAKSSSGLDLHIDLNLAADAAFTKSRSDGFSNPQFEAWLSDHKVGTIEVAGLDGCYCVNTTSTGAINRGFDVVLHEELILTTNEDKWSKLRRALLERGASCRATR